MFSARTRFWTRRLKSLVWICVWTCRLHWWWGSLHHSSSIFPYWQYAHFYGGPEIFMSHCYKTSYEGQDLVRQNSGRKNMLTHEYFRDMFSLSLNFLFVSLNVLLKPYLWSGDLNLTPLCAIIRKTNQTKYIWYKRSSPVTVSDHVQFGFRPGMNHVSWLVWNSTCWFS